MWSILKAEFNYHKKIFLGFSIFVPLLRIYATSPIEDLPPNYLMFWMMFLMVQSWYAFRNKEKRERQLTRLPITMRKMALARIFMVIISSLSFIVFYAIMYFVLDPVKPVNQWIWIVSFGIILFGFSVYFILADLFSDFFRKIGFTKNTMVVGIALFMIGFALLGLFFSVTTSATGKPPIPIGPIIQFIKVNNPFGGEYGIAKFMVLSIVSACLSVVTYGHRKSYLE
ncbi:MAG: hypothetical protein ACE5JB_08635 [bacterium]